MQMFPRIIVIKNSNSNCHKLFPTPNAANCTHVPSFKGLCQGMFDYGMRMQYLGRALVQPSQQDLSRRENWAEGYGEIGLYSQRVTSRRMLGERMSQESLGPGENGDWHRMSSLEEDYRARQILLSLTQKRGALLQDKGDQQPWEPPFLLQDGTSYDPQTLRSWKAGCISSWLLCLKACLGAFLLDALLLSNQQTRLLFKDGKFFMRHSYQEPRQSWKN